MDPKIIKMLDKAFKNKKFHDNSETDYRIKVMFLWFDDKSRKMKLSYKDNIRLYNVFIQRFIKYEEYEMAIAFKKKKWDVQKKWRLERRDFNLIQYYRLYRRKLRAKILSHLK